MNLDIEFKLNTEFQLLHKNQEFIKAPQLKESEPRRANLSMVGDDRIDDENLWIWDLFVYFKELMKKASDPLSEYLTHFK